MRQCREEYARWCENATDSDMLRALSEIADSDSAIEDAFSGELTFGTGGLRGILGVGTARMNIYTVSRATRGVAKYAGRVSDTPSAAIGYDTRKGSRELAHAAAEIFSRMGVSVHVFSEPLPTPMLSYAVRTLGTTVGVMITASHNPREYNGYKVYGADGCQITDGVAGEILGYIRSSDYFGVEGDAHAPVKNIPDTLFDEYIARISKCSVLYGDVARKDIKIVYTALSGTGYKPIMRVLGANGYTHIHPVTEQCTPDPDFTTCPRPNPELDEALMLAAALAERVSADVVLATDPDSDRVGVMIPRDGGYVRISGNEVGALLLDYVASQRSYHGTMPKEPIVIKSVVTAPIIERIAASYGAMTHNVLTGFKYIGEMIGRLEEEGRAEDLLIGLEESCGYLTAPYVRDKDGVAASLLIAEMTALYRARGITLSERLDELYSRHGYEVNLLVTETLEGDIGSTRIREFMRIARTTCGKVILGVTAEGITDYLGGIYGLPPTDSVTFTTDGLTVTVRPSGTEPKIKLYITATSCDRERADITARETVSRIRAFINNS